MHRSLPAIAVLSLSLSALPGRALGQINVLPEGLAGVGIDEKPGALAPRDLAFTDQDGQPVRLGDYFDGKHPVALVLAYYQCPMLCSLVLNGLTEGLRPLGREAGWTPGDRFRVLTVSFDPRDTAAKAAAKRDSQLESYGRKVPARGWDFLVGDPASVGRLADAVGFRFRWDAKDQQFAHPAAAFVFTSDGRLSRTLYGIRFSPKDLRLALVEASEGKLGTTWDRVLLFCFHYDPAAKGYVLLARRVMEAAGVVTVLALAAFLVLLFRPVHKKGALITAPRERVV